MSRKGSFVVRFVGAFACALAVASSAAAQGKTPPPQLVINVAAIEGDTLSLTGASFGNAPTVYLAGEKLPLLTVSPDGTHLTAQITWPLDDGSFLVQVSKGPATTQNAAF